MSNAIGQRIFRHRKKLKMTQDEMGARYSISGPAVFKFEKGYVVPSLDLWLKMAKDMNLSERTAVLLHTQEKLPEPYRSMIGFENMFLRDEANDPEREDFSKHKDEKSLRKAVLNNNWLPSGLLEFVRREDLWTLYRPTGGEINILRDVFGPLGEGCPRDFCEAIRLLREFQGARD